MPTTAALEALTARCAASLPANHNGAGEPVRRDCRIVNGHRVTVRLTGWGDVTPSYEVDWSTEPLTFAEAVSRVEA